MKKQHIFEINYRSEVDDTTYSGTFTAKKLSVRDQSKLNVRKAQLNGGLYHMPDNPGCGIDEYTDEFNQILAHLEVAIINAPQWWDLDQIGDSGVIVEVFKEVATFENSFLTRGNQDLHTGQQSLSQSGQGGSQENVGQANSTGAASVVVDEKVQSALEP